MDRSGGVQAIELLPPTESNAEVILRTEIPMPALLTIHWKHGGSSNILPMMLGLGQTRNVLGGACVDTTTMSPWVIKLSEWENGRSKNEREYDLATDILWPFMPYAVGCVRCEYGTRRGSHTLSALVVSRVSTTMDAHLAAVFHGPAVPLSVRLFMRVIYAVFSMVHELYGSRGVQLAYLYTSNIGIVEDYRVVLLHAEAFHVHDQRNHARASRALGPFFDGVTTMGESSGAHRDWGRCTRVALQHIYTEWWATLPEIPSLDDIDNRITECLDRIVGPPRHAHPALLPPDHLPPEAP